MRYKNKILLFSLILFALTFDLVLFKIGGFILQAFLIVLSMLALIVYLVLSLFDFYKYLRDRG